MFLGAVADPCVSGPGGSDLLRGLAGEPRLGWAAKEGTGDSTPGALAQRQLYPSRCFMKGVREG